MIRRTLRDFTAEERRLIRNWTWGVVAVYGSIFIAVAAGIAHVSTDGTRVAAKVNSSDITVGGGSLNK